jgi:hypothetical protein
LLDSGASHNFMSLNEFMKFDELYQKYSNSVSVRLADGKVVDIVGYA